MALDFGTFKPFFEGKFGLEVGGPSDDLFGQKIPIYEWASAIDGCNFRADTVWAKHDEDYVIAAGKKGKQYISEASDLIGIANEKYDFLLASHCLEHCANSLKTVREWLRVMKTGGIILLVLPDKTQIFDRHRPVTSFAHLLSDFHNNIGENDLTHVNEIMLLHDLASDPQAGDIHAFRARSLKNFENRCLHHHVFDFDLLIKIFGFFDIKVIGAESIPPYNQVIMGMKV